MHRSLRRFIVLAALSAGLSMPAAASDWSDHQHLIQRLQRESGMQGEFVLRMIALGLENRELAGNFKARHQLQADDVVCEFLRPVGTRFTYVSCREYQDFAPGMQATEGGATAELHNRGAVKGVEPILKADRTIVRFRVREPELRAAIAALPGLPEMNRRLVAEGLSDRSVPEGLPTRDELGRFADATAQIRSIDRRYARRGGGSGWERAVIGAVRDAGFSVDRYNELVDLTNENPELYAFVENRRDRG